jgi:hypothetical protein
MRNEARTVVALGTAGLAAIALSACGGSGATTKHVTWDTKEGPGGFVDAEPAAPKPKGEEPPQVSAGDQLSLAEDVYDSSGKKVGSVDGGCVITVPGKDGDLATSLGQCTATATVPGGSLAISQGGMVFGERSSGTIVGGTGSYAGASGTCLDVHDAATGEMTFTIDVSIPS